MTALTFINLLTPTTITKKEYPQPTLRYHLTISSAFTYFINNRRLLYLWHHLQLTFQHQLDFALGSSMLAVDAASALYHLLAADQSNLRQFFRCLILFEEGPVHKPLADSKFEQMTAIRTVDQLQDEFIPSINNLFGMVSRRG